MMQQVMFFFISYMIVDTTFSFKFYCKQKKGKFILMYFRCYYFLCCQNLHFIWLYCCLNDKGIEWMCNITAFFNAEIFQMMYKYGVSMMKFNFSNVYILLWDRYDCTNKGDWMVDKLTIRFTLNFKIWFVYLKAFI